MGIFLALALSPRLPAQDVVKPLSGEAKMDILANVTWLGHAAVRIGGKQVIYIDPYELKDGPVADIILVTHDHFDHLSAVDIAKIQGAQTIIVIPEGYQGKVKGHVQPVRPGEKITVSGVEVQAVPAYNIGKTFHPREKGYVGYVLKAEGITYYHAGDTDHIPEMKTIRTDVAFLPVGGTYTMTATEAARATQDIQPKVAVPIHWGSIVGARQDAEAFKKAAHCPVSILTRK